MKSEHEEKLASLVMNNLFNSTCYGDKTADEKTIVELAKATNQLFVAKLAIYAYKVGKLRDTSALLLACVTEPSYFKAAAKHVLNNVGQIRKYVNYKRSGITGSKSLGSVPKTVISHMLNSYTPRDLWANSDGTNPSISDVIKLTHSKPRPELDSLYKLFLGYEVDPTTLDMDVQSGMKEMEQYLSGSMKDRLPTVPASKLKNGIKDMSKTQLICYIEMLTPNQVRREWATLCKNTNFTFEVRTLALSLLGQLNPKHILPASLLTSIEASTDVEYYLILSTILERSLTHQAEELCKVINRPLTLAIDVSGSMRRLIRTACMLAYPLAKNSNVTLQVVSNKSSIVTPSEEDLASYENFLEFIEGLADWGGTKLSSVFDIATGHDVMIISDNESWRDGAWFNKHWKNYQAYRAKDIKPGEVASRLISWDIAPNSNTVLSRAEPTVLNLSGFSDNLYNVIASYMDGNNNLLTQILNVEL